MEVMDVIISVVMLLLVIYLYLDHKYSYWSSRNVPYIVPSYFYGNLKNIGRTDHIGELFQKFYGELKGKNPYGFCGIYFFFKPVVMVTGLDFVKDILIRDFQHFHDRGNFYNERDDPLSAHLFNMEGQKWRALRAKLTPTFTSGKMKYMYPTIIAVGKQFNDFLIEEVEKCDEIEMKDILARFTTDVIGTCAFGLDCNSMKNPDSLFRQMGKKFLTTSRGRVKNFIITTSWTLARFLRVKTISQDIEDFFFKVVAETIEYREKNKVERNDFMDLLIKMKNTDEKTDGLTFNEIVAQSFLFWLAGFETSSTTMTYCLYELSINQDIQEKARKHVKDILAKHNGELSYEAMMDMTYLDQCINETLRMYPPVVVHFRNVTKDYVQRESKFKFPAGMRIAIPVYAIQRDPEIYPEPNKFDPERFTAENMANRHVGAFTPFGEGPRICIGLRFGMMQARIGLVYLLSNFKFSSCSKSTVPLVFDKKSFILAPAGGLWLKVEKL